MSPLTPDETADYATTFENLAEAVSTVVLGKPDVVRMALTALCTQGHLLLEDVPGVGKTTLARAIAAVVRGQWRRIQFTPDLLPADVVGVTIFNQATRGFEFHPGPIFA
ncbi:AAA family ATPase, partial [Micromonospora sonneratiae]